jgi:hypothetical protein
VLRGRREKMSQSGEIRANWKERKDESVRRETVWVVFEELPVVRQVERDDQRREEVMNVLFRVKSSKRERFWSSVATLKRRARRTKDRRTNK